MAGGAQDPTESRGDAFRFDRYDKRPCLQGHARSALQVQDERILVGRPVNRLSNWEVDDTSERSPILVRASCPVQAMEAAKELPIADKERVQATCPAGNDGKPGGTCEERIAE